MIFILILKEKNIHFLNFPISFLLFISNWSLAEAYLKDKDKTQANYPKNKQYSGKGYKNKFGLQRRIQEFHIVLSSPVSLLIFFFNSLLLFSKSILGRDVKGNL